MIKLLYIRVSLNAIKCMMAFQESGTLSTEPSRPNNPSGFQKKPSVLLREDNISHRGRSGRSCSWFFAALMSASIASPQCGQMNSLPFLDALRTRPQSEHR